MFFCVFHENWDAGKALCCHGDVSQFPGSDDVPFVNPEEVNGEAWLVGAHQGSLHSPPITTQASAWIT